MKNLHANKKKVVEMENKLDRKDLVYETGNKKQDDI